MTGSTTHVDIHQISEALGITPRAAQASAARENWRYVEKAVRGGRKRLYPISCLPSQTQAALAVDDKGAALDEGAEIVALRPVRGCVMIEEDTVADDALRAKNAE